MTVFNSNKYQQQINKMMLCEYQNTRVKTLNRHCFRGSSM